MAKWIVIPEVSVNGIKFKDAREFVRSAIKKIDGDRVFREFKKNKYSVNTTDDYGDFHIFYDENDRFEAIEFYEGEEVYIGDHKVFPADYQIINKIMPELNGDGVNFISNRCSVGVTVIDNKVESILIGCHNYFQV